MYVEILKLGRIVEPSQTRVEREKITNNTTNIIENKNKIKKVISSAPSLSF